LTALRAAVNERWRGSSNRIRFVIKVRTNTPKRFEQTDEVAVVERQYPYLIARHEPVLFESCPEATAVRRDVHHTPNLADFQNKSIGRGLWRSMSC
jgi:hypothetical protein